MHHKLQRNERIKIWGIKDNANTEDCVDNEDAKGDVEEQRSCTSDANDDHQAEENHDSSESTGSHPTGHNNEGDDHHQLKFYVWQLSSVGLQLRFHAC